jgi:hypothetical protein
MFSSTNYYLCFNTTTCVPSADLTHAGHSTRIAALLLNSLMYLYIRTYSRLDPRRVLDPHHRLAFKRL